MGGQTDIPDRQTYQTDIQLFTRGIDVGGTNRQCGISE